MVVTSVFVILGLLEVEQVESQLGRLRGSPRRAGREGRLAASATKLRAYMIVRSFASVLTGVAVWPSPPIWASTSPSNGA